MVNVGTLAIDPPLANSSCPWASTREQLVGLYSCRFTGATVTRTATLDGFAEDTEVHKHFFFGPDGKATSASDSEAASSLNTYGYSPRPLSEYLEDVESILKGSMSDKPFIISVTGTLDELPTLSSHVQDLRRRVGDIKRQPYSRIGLELNTSCPNIPGYPPPAYDPPALKAFVAVLADAVKNDPSLTVGIKLPPYTYRDQFVTVVDALQSVTESGSDRCPIAYLAATNTLGSCAVQTGGGDATEGFSIGGVGGDSIHALSLGNVAQLSRLLKERGSHLPALGAVRVVGIGGVRSRAGFDRMLRAGADVVACATALGRSGLGAFEGISK